MVCFWLGKVLRATAAFTFSTSQLPKVLRRWCVLFVLISKCAARHCGVHFFDMSTSKSAPSMVCFARFPESVWAKGSSKSSNSGGLFYIFTYHLRPFTSSHLILTYHLRIFTSTHTISSSHLHIFTSYPHIFTSSLSLCLSLSLSLSRSHEVPKTVVKLQFNILDGNPFARNEVRSPKAVEKLRFVRFGGNPFARNEVRSSKPGVKLQLCASAAALSHAMRFDRQNRGVKLQLCASSFHLPVSSQFFFLRLLRFIFLLFLLQVCLPFFNVWSLPL